MKAYENIENFVLISVKRFQEFYVDNLLSDLRKCTTLVIRAKILAREAV